MLQVIPDLRSPPVTIYRFIFYRSIYPTIDPSISPSIYLPAYPSISLSIYLSTYPSIYLPYSGKTTWGDKAFFGLMLMARSSWCRACSTLPSAKRTRAFITASTWNYSIKHGILERKLQKRKVKRRKPENTKMLRDQNSWGTSHRHRVSGRPWLKFTADTE